MESPVNGRKMGVLGAQKLSESAKTKGYSGPNIRNFRKKRKD
jgi:hypothetical protein